MRARRCTVLSRFVRDTVSSSRCWKRVRRVSGNWARGTAWAYREVSSKLRMPRPLPATIDTPRPGACGWSSGRSCTSYSRIPSSTKLSSRNHSRSWATSSAWSGSTSPRVEAAHLGGDLGEPSLHRMEVAGRRHHVDEQPPQGLLEVTCLLVVERGVELDVEERLTVGGRAGRDDVREASVVVALDPDDGMQGPHNVEPAQLELFRDGRQEEGTVLGVDLDDRARLAPAVECHLGREDADVELAGGPGVGEGEGADQLPRRLAGVRGVELLRRHPSQGRAREVDDHLAARRRGVGADLVEDRVESGRGADVHWVGGLAWVWQGLPLALIVLPGHPSAASPAGQGKPCPDVPTAPRRAPSQGS